MATLLPFKALRAKPEYVDTFTISAAEADRHEDIDEFIKEHSNSYLQVLNPQMFSEKKLQQSEIYTAAKAHISRFLNENIVVQEENPSLYIYRQVKGNNVFTAIIGLADISEYNNQEIKRHELTQTHKEEQIAKYFEEVGVNGNPVLLTYPHRAEITLLIQELVESAPTYHFTSEDEIEHALWAISSEKDIQKLQAEFSKTEALYIADGHHRCAALSLLYPNVKNFMGCFIADDQMVIHGFHRYIKDIGDLSADAFIAKLRENEFEVSKTDKIKTESFPGTVSLYINQNWYSINFPEKLKNSTNPKQNLDVYILDKYIFCDILGIENTRTSNRLKYVNGEVSSEVLMGQVDKGNFKAAFVLSPVKVDEIISVSDFGETMPPKSTWIEPKLRSGLLLHKF